MIPFAGALPCRSEIREPSANFLPCFGTERDIKNHAVVSGGMSGSELTYGYLSLLFFQSLNLARQKGVRLRTGAQAIDRLTEAGQIAAESRAEGGQGQVIVIPDQQRYH